jgi:3-dehydroquinate synthetase
VKRIMQAIDRDKKIGRRGYRFVLPKAIGRVEVVEGMPRKDIRWAVQNLLREA